MNSVPGWSRTGSDIVSEIDMAKTNWKGPYLLVEGPTDVCFFGARVLDSVYIVEASGKPNVESAMQILDTDPAHASTVALGIVDEDYDWLTGHSPPSPNIVKFDPRDLEAMLVRSSGLRAVLAEFADRASVLAFEAANGPVLDALLSRADFFGRIRMHNVLNARVSLKKFKAQRFCDVATWSYNHTDALAAAVGLGVHTSEPALQSELAALPAPSPWHVARGHDLVDILVGGLLGVLGGGSIRPNDVERVLRQGMQTHEFHSSGVFTRTSAWQLGKSASYM